MLFLQAVGEALIDEDSAVSKEALKTQYAIQLRINPTRACDELLTDPRIEKDHVISFLRKHGAAISSSTLVKALDNNDEHIRLLGIEELQRRNEFAREIALRLKADVSQKILVA